MRHSLSLEERFWSKVNKTDTCWLWTAGLFTTGYGQFGIGRTNHKAHRVSYELSIGKIPQSLVVDHLCRVRNCVNPQHLELVTQQDNILRGEGVAANNAKKTTCSSGHDYIERMFTAKDGRRKKRRYCPQCQSAQSALKRMQRKFTSVH